MTLRPIWKEIFCILHYRRGDKKVCFKKDSEDYIVCWLPHTAYTYSTCQSGLGICSFTHRLFAHLLIVLKSNEHFWAIRSDSSRKMRDHEWITQVAQRKWATMSELLRMLKTNEQPWANCSGRSRQMSDRERFAQVAQRKWATLRELLRLLKTNELPRGRKWANEQFAQKNSAKKI